MVFLRRKFGNADCVIIDHWVASVVVTKDHFPVGVDLVEVAKHLHASLNVKVNV